jgi:lipid II:glycine glycyltransferase (peptidoglycan interpeptide bridge formation enzyme)
MITIKTIDNRPEWDRALAGLPAAHVLQSWAWGEFKSRWGWTAERLLWLEDGAPAAAAQILARAIPYTPWRFLYVTKGPALAYGNSGLAGRVLADLEEYSRRAGALFIKIDPDVARQYGEPAEGCPPEPAGQATLALLARRGWRFSPEQIQFRNTVWLDLSPTPDELLAGMKSKWRYNIRLAERKGVAIDAGTAAELPLFYRMYAETGARDGFLIRPESYYLDGWRQFIELGQAELLLARVGDEVVAGLILFFFGPTAWYMYGASTGQQRQLMPNYLLQWQALCRARARGCTRYDLWGAPDLFGEGDPMWGVYRFKQGFGGRVVQGLGAFDYPARPALYWAFVRALPRLRAVWRRVVTRG